MVTCTIKNVYYSVKMLTQKKHIGNILDYKCARRNWACAQILEILGVILVCLLLTFVILVYLLVEFSFFCLLNFPFLSFFHIHSDSAQGFFMIFIPQLFAGILTPPLALFHKFLKMMISWFCTCVKWKYSENSEKCERVVSKYV